MEAGFFLIFYGFDVHFASFSVWNLALLRNVWVFHFCSIWILTTTAFHFPKVYFHASNADIFSHCVQIILKSLFRCEKHCFKVFLLKQKLENFIVIFKDFCWDSGCDSYALSFKTFPRKSSLAVSTSTTTCLESTWQQQCSRPKKEHNNNRKQVNNFVISSQYSLEKKNEWEQQKKFSSSINCFFKNKLRTKRKILISLVIYHFSIVNLQFAFVVVVSIVFQQGNASLQPQTRGPCFESVLRECFHQMKM
jgi:hypothetical protein